MLGVAMVTGEAFTTVLEHHLNSINPGEWALLLTWYLRNFFPYRLGGPGNLLCTIRNQPVVGCCHIVHRDRETNGRRRENGTIHQWSVNRKTGQHQIGIHHLIT